MKAEFAYLQLLEQTKSFKVDDAQPTLYDESDKESLIFTAAKA